MNNSSDPTIEEMKEAIKDLQSESIISILTLHNTVIVKIQNEKIAWLEGKGMINHCAVNVKELVLPELKTYCSDLVKSYRLELDKTLNSIFSKGKSFSFVWGIYTFSR